MAAKKRKSSTLELIPKTFSRRQVFAIVFYVAGTALVLAVRESMVLAMLGLFLILVAAIDQFGAKLKMWQQVLVLAGFLIIGFIPISLVNGYHYFRAHACLPQGDCPQRHHFTPTEQIDRMLFGQSR